MKGSSWEIIKAHGWRIDRAIHYYIYFKHYHSYVRILLNAMGEDENKFAHLDPNSLKYKTLTRIQKTAEKLVFARYHGKVLTPANVTKIIEVQEDVTLGTDTTRKIPLRDGIRISAWRVRIKRVELKTKLSHFPRADCFPHKFFQYDLVQQP